VIRLLEKGYNRWANGAIANNLAEGAESAEVLARVQIRGTHVIELADSHGVIAVVVKNLNGKEIEFTSERQADNKCAQPVSVSRFARPSQVERSLLVHPSLLRSGSPRLKLIVLEIHEVGNAECLPGASK
jgi:hypothetical protein